MSVDAGLVCAIYARKSTEQHGVADEAKSVARQVEHAKRYARRRGWQVDPRHIYIDDAISGARFDRPAFQRLMAALKPKPQPASRLGLRRLPARVPFSVLIVMAMDRLGREQIQTSWTLQQLSRAGVRVFSYLEDRELLLASAHDKFMLSVTSFVDEAERERCRARTYDAMQAKARNGFITGGRCFGYTNQRVNSHVERVINEQEAAVIRRIFDLSSHGMGHHSIAKTLNAEGACAPRPQQGRPQGWAATSVRAILYRDLYRGAPVWNKTQTLDMQGVQKQVARPESEWLRVEVPEARIVSDDLWEAAHAQLRQRHHAYMRVTGGKRFGRPLNGTVSKYLLTGLASCAVCGGTIEVRTRSHGSGTRRVRVAKYGCATYSRRGKRICANGLEVRVDRAEAIVLAEIEKQLLTTDFIADVVGRVLVRASGADAAHDDKRAELVARIAEGTVVLQRLVEGLAHTGASPAITSAIRTRESQQAALEQELTSLTQRLRVSDATISRVEALARAKMKEFRSLLHRQPAAARLVLQQMLRDRLVLTPDTRGDERGYRFSGEGSLMPVLAGMIPELSQGLASPTGFEPVSWP